MNCLVTAQCVKIIKMFYRNNKSVGRLYRLLGEVYGYSNRPTQISENRGKFR